MSMRNRLWIRDECRSDINGARCEVTARSRDGEAFLCLLHSIYKLLIGSKSPPVFGCFASSAPTSAGRPSSPQRPSDKNKS
jgi:hypothetical protein